MNDFNEQEFTRVREERDRQRTNVTFWRSATAALMMFILGNGVSYIVFGLKTASKEDLDRVVTIQNNQIDNLSQQLQVLNRTVQEQTGELRARHMISGNPN